MSHDLVAVLTLFGVVLILVLMLAGYAIRRP